MKYDCQNCGRVLTEDQLQPLRDAHLRCEPGDVMPYGECPDCGAACFEHTDEIVLRWPREWVEDVHNIMRFENEDEGAEPEDHERRVAIENALYDALHVKGLT